MPLHSFPTDALRSWVCELFRSMGSSPNEARLAADHLVGANLAGHDSHGVGMLPVYVESFLGGQLRLNREVEVVVDTGSMLVVDGGMGVGQSVAHQAMELAIERAREHGIALMGLRNAHHIGRIGHWSEMAIDAGLVGIHFTNAISPTPVVAPHGGAEARFVTNPFTVGIPVQGGDPILLDFATSMIAHGKARVAMQQGLPVPPGTVIDSNGEPTLDARVLFETPTGALKTFAEHKGHALSIVCELLGAAMIGGPTGHRVNHLAVPGVMNNMMAIVFDPDRLGSADSFAREVSSFVDWLRATKLDAAGRKLGGVLLPGEPERRSRAERALQVPIDDNTLAALADAARSVGAPDPRSLVAGSQGRARPPGDGVLAVRTKAAGPTAALLLIGSELLSGRTQDVNMAHLATRLGSRGIRLAESRVVPDVQDVIVRAVNDLRRDHDLVFTTGGIGPTHDDITADCIAAAFGVGIGIDEEARRRLLEFWTERGIEPNDDRLRMARVPEGARLIDNPVSVAPGFVIGNVHVMAGVPKIMQAMLENVLPTLPEGALVRSASVVAHDLGEGDIAKPLRELQARHPDIDIGSYPGQKGGRSRIELVARGTDEDALAAVAAELAALVSSLGRGA